MNCLCGGELKFMGDTSYGDSIYFCYRCGSMLISDDQECSWHRVGGVTNERKVGGKWIPDN